MDLEGANVTAVWRGTAPKRQADAGFSKPAQPAFSRLHAKEGEHAHRPQSRQ